MTAKIYSFPGGEQSKLPRWTPPVSAGVWFIGVRQTLVPDREGLVTQEPYFLVEVYRGVADDKAASFKIEVEGVKGLHATLNILVDAARARNQDFSVADYSNGETKLAEEYRVFSGQQ